MPVTRTSGQGRPKGALNKNTNELAALAKEYGPPIIARLAEMAGLVGANPSESEQTQLGAMRELLDRGYGKPAQAITGPDGGALEFSYVVRAPTPVESVGEWLTLHAPSDQRTPPMLELTKTKD